MSALQSHPPLLTLTRVCRALLFVTSCLLALCFQCSAQSIATNKITTEAAVKITSRLRLGMDEQQANAFLSTNGFGLGSNVYSMSIGCSHGWTTPYVLADGHRLDLDFRPESIRSDGMWGGNGLLERAAIRNNDVDSLFHSIDKCRTRRSSEPETADSLSDKFNAGGGWLSSLTSRVRRGE